MTDRFKEQAENLLRSLSPFWFERQDALASALSEAYEAGRLEEREAVISFFRDDYVRNFDIPWRADLEAAIRSRENKA